MKIIFKNNILFMSLCLLIFIGCLGQEKNNNKTEKKDSINKERIISEEELSEIFQRNRQNQKHTRLNNSFKIKEDSIRLKMYPNLSSYHKNYDSVLVAKPLINEYGEFRLSPETIRFSPHNKIRKINWNNEEKNVSLSNIGNKYTVANDKLVIIDNQENKILFFNSLGEKISTIKSPDLKSKLMLEGRKDYNGEKWEIKPQGIEVKDENGNAIHYKSTEGDLGWFRGLIEIDKVEYLMITILGGQNIEIQFLNLQSMEWLNTAMWMGIL